MSCLCNRCGNNSGCGCRCGCQNEAQNQCGCQQAQNQCGCQQNQCECWRRRIFKEGYNAGYSAGYEVGYRDGFMACRNSRVADNGCGCNNAQNAAESRCGCC